MVFHRADDAAAWATELQVAVANEPWPGGVEVRLQVGLHTGECELLGDDIGGVAVHIGARMEAKAMPGEVLVSSTVKDLVVGSGR